jgi:hypothetical protein
MVRVLAPVFLMVLAWNNWLVASLDADAETDSIIFGTFLVIAASAVLLLPTVRYLLSNPHQRWWLTPERKKIHIRARVRPADGGGELIAQTFDISEEGVFISLERANWSAGSSFSTTHNATRSLSVGSHCAVVLDLQPNRTVNGIARIVRHAPARGKYPKGFAVYFEGLQKRDRALLKDFVKKIPTGLSDNVISLRTRRHSSDRSGIDDTRIAA